MENQWLEQTPMSGTFGHGRVRPVVCVIDHKQHIRIFLRDILDELGFITFACAEFSEFHKRLHPENLDLIVLRLSDVGDRNAEMLKTLARKKFTGKILLLGPSASLALPAAQQFGEKLGLAMVPVLRTPFDTVSLCISVASLLLMEAVPTRRLDIAQASVLRLPRIPKQNHCASLRLAAAHPG